MRAVIFRAYGGPNVLELDERPIPEPAEGEVLIRVRAAAVNPADGKWRSGMFADFIPLSLPHVLGYDVAGEIVAGDGFPAGTRVAGMLDPIAKGGYAEYAVARSDLLAPIPDRLDFVTAAAIPTAGLTGMQMAENAVDAQPGQWILLTGAVGAVGRFALHALRARGARVVVAIRERQRDEAVALGADRVLALGAEDWTGDAFDHVIDTVGGDAVGKLCRHLRPGGRIITAATTPIPSDGLSAQPEFYAVQPGGGDVARLMDMAASGAIAVPVAVTMPLAEAAEAQRRTDAGGLGGKIVLLP